MRATIWHTATASRTCGGRCALCNSNLQFPLLTKTQSSKCDAMQRTILAVLAMTLLILRPKHWSPCGFYISPCFLFMNMVGPETNNVMVTLVSSWSQQCAHLGRKINSRRQRRVCARARWHCPGEGVRVVWCGGVWCGAVRWDGFCDNVIVIHGQH